MRVLFRWGCRRTVAKAEIASPLTLIIADIASLVLSPEVTEPKTSSENLPRMAVKYLFLS